MTFFTGKKLFGFTLLFLFSVCVANGQLIRLSTERDTFIDDFEKVFQNGENAIAIAEFETFKTHYQNDLSQDGQQAFIRLSTSMAARNHKMAEYYRLLVLLNPTFDPLVFEPEEQEKFITYLRQLVNKQPLRKAISVFVTLTNFFDKQLLYTSKFNKLYALNGTFEFEYLDQKQDYFEPGNSVPEVQKEKTEDAGFFDDWDNTEEIDPWDAPSLIIDPNEFYRLLPLPLISDLVIKFTDVDLVLVTPSDSMLLTQTSGAADLVHDLWIGEKGSVTWENVSLPDAKAEFTEYSFKLSSPYLNAEKVSFVYDSLLLEPIEGIFEFKGTERNANVLSSYPRFKSNENNAQFKNFEDNLDYKGGFSLIGNRVFSTSLYHNISTLWVNKGQENSFKVEGKKIEFTDSLITADQVSFVTHIQDDSISHPAVKLRYSISQKQLNLYKLPHSGFRTAMYSDTFHEMDISCDAMQWDLETGKMDFYIIAGKSAVAAVFESFNYYNPARLRQLSNIAGFNPLIFLGNYVYRKRRNRFDLFEIQNKIRKTPAQIKNGVILAMQMGFIDHEPHSDTYKLSRKGLHYFKAATGRGDYDDLAFASVASNGGGGNAVIDRNSNTLDIAGTQEFKLSDSLGIRFLPRNQSLKMEGSKFFKFAGEIVVKNYRFIGDFEVDYEHFLVNLKRIDSILFTPIAIYNAGGVHELGGHVAYGKTGTLFLNSPNNKSGKKYLPQYPRLVIDDGATLAFNNAARGNYGYPDNVFFKTDKIDHDSLNVRDLAYDGIFSSGGIIKPIRETLVVMPDTSIGFTHQPRGTYELYKTAAIFDFKTPLEMTKKGLVAEGELSHLAAKMSTQKTHFGANQMTFSGESASIKETFTSRDLYFPEVVINNYKAVWKPTADSLIINSEEDYSFYNASTMLNGRLVVRSSGLYGQGELIRDDSHAESEAIKFNKKGFLASESEFIIKTEEGNGKPILEGHRVQLDFNIDEGLVTISPETGNGFNDTLSSSIAFPYAAYETTIDNASWNIKRKSINMLGDVKTSKFMATDPKQYSLSFYGGSAHYDIAANTLNVSGVPGINSVDAIIVPKNGRVAILKEGRLEPFTDAIVIADTLNQFHTLAHADITVKSKQSYSGTASYQFVNVSSDTFNIEVGNFEFAEISTDRQILRSGNPLKFSTIAKAKVTEADSIYLSPKILYVGEIIMLAPFRNLGLKGQVTPVLDQYPVLGRNWINYSGNKSEEISIPVNETLKDGGKRLFAGLHLKATSGSEGLYPTFLSAKSSGSDADIFLANGIFKRDEPEQRFTIYPLDSNQRNATQNKYELYEKEGLIKLQGHFNFLKPDLASFIETVGIGTVDLDSMEYTFNTLMKFNLPLSQPLLLKMGDNIVKTNLDIGNSEPAIAFEDPDFLTKMAQMVGTKTTEDYQTEYYKGHIPLFESSPKFFSSILFSDLKLKWNPVFNSFHSTGTLGVSNIGETDINAQIPGYFEIIKNPRTGDEIYIFLEVSSDSWYYLGYKNGQLGVISSDFEFNKMLQSKDKPQTSKGVELINVDMVEAMQFRKRFLMTYLGVSEEAFNTPKRAPSSVPGKIAPVAIPSTDGKTTTPSSTTTTLPKKKVEEVQDGF